MNILFFLFFCFLLFSLVYASLSLAPWAPTRRKDILRLEEIFSPQSGEKFLELGCGDGRVAFTLAQKHPEIQVYGYELAIPLFFLAFGKTFFATHKNYHISLKNIFSGDFGSYDHIYMFGMPDKIAEKILPKFESEAKKGAKLYSYVFSFPESYNAHVESF